MDPQWGCNPDTLESVATALAAVFAAVAACIAWREWKRGNDRDRRKHVESVGVWTTLDPESRTSFGAALRYAVVLHVANDSSLPVLDVRVTTDPAQSLGEGVEPGMQLFPSVGPKVTLTAELGHTSPHDALGGPPRVLSVELTDNAGVRWRRDERGKLHEVRRSRLLGFLAGILSRARRR